MRFGVLLVTGLLCVVGCARPIVQLKAGPPPLKVSFRKSQIPNQGMVANVNNPSSTETIKLAVVFVLGKGQKVERSYRLNQEVKPLDSVTIGWVQLDGWKLSAGDKLRIQCVGFDADLACEVAE